MPKNKITRTLGPIHFEDLEPHRFEDLIRELLYDYKDWQSIEATGRGGSDDGFDIRAYEKTTISHQISDDEKEEDIVHPMDGNLWMIQCKREKSVGPTKIADIISTGVSKDDPPYGYILVAATNFSKKSYDIFREGLRKRGVMEFMLWGKAEHEDMLLMPKYDRILFTFFGISLVSSRRSKTTAIRASILVKNKLYKLLGENPDNKPLFIRNLHDDQYPYEKEYRDFDVNPRWQACYAAGYNVKGIWVVKHTLFGYFDSVKKEWDYAPGFELSKPGEENDSSEVREKTKKRFHVNHTLEITNYTWEALNKERSSLRTLFFLSDDPSIQNKDFIGVKTSGITEIKIIEVNCKYSISVKEYIEYNSGYGVKENIEQHIGRNIDEKEILFIYEFEKAHPHQWEDAAQI